MIRRTSRELVVQSLFQIDFSGCSAEEALNAAVEEQNSKNALKAQNYAQIALNGILNSLAEIDAKITEFSIFGVQTTQSQVCTYPQPAVSVFQNSINNITR